MSCTQIAQLIEHAYCTADSIIDEILNPSMRSMNSLSTIKEYLPESDDNEKGDGDGDGSDKDKGVVGLLFPKEIGPKISGQSGGAVAPAKQSKLREDRGGKNSEKKKSTTGAFCFSVISSCSAKGTEKDYFILPLTIENIATHAR